MIFESSESLSDETVSDETDFISSKTFNVGDISFSPIYIPDFFDIL